MKDKAQQQQQKLIIIGFGELRLKFHSLWEYRVSRWRCVKVFLKTYSDLEAKVGQRACMKGI